MGGILISLIAGAVMIGVAAFWRALQGFVMQAVAKLKTILVGALAESASVFVRKSVDGVKQLAATYLKQGNRYLEKIVSQSVDESTLPDDIRQKAQNNYDEEVDITNRFAQELKLA